MSRVEDLKLDVAELQALQEKAERPKVQELLGLEIRKLQTIIVNLEEQQKSSDASNVPTDKPVAVVTAVARRQQKEITTYGWDQSEKFMKIYVTLNGIQSHAKESITCTFKNRSFKLHIENFEGKDQTLHVANLHEDIIVDDSYYKVKTDMVLVMLKKKTAGKTWPYVILKEDKKKDIKKSDAGEDKDPGAGLMNMLKQMYDDGDDEMKRTIAKAWTESRNKEPDMPM